MSVMTAPTMLDALLTPGVLSTRFQPIIEETDGRARVFAFECLTRGPAGTNFASADVLFEYARRMGGECMLDRACAAQALVTGSAIADCDFSINIHASTLGRDRGFVRDLAAVARACGVDAKRIIIEIVEHAPPASRRDFLTSLCELRAQGFRVALDDVGLGHSNFKMMIDCVPDYLKVDRLFTHGAYRDPFRAAVLESVTGFARRVDTRVIAEGIEDDDDRTFLRNLGVELLQGYLYARPMRIDDAKFFRATTE